MDIEIVEGNKLILGFDGYMDFNTMDSDKQSWLLHESRYDESWDLLFPVIDKINSLGKEYHLAIFKTYVSVSVEKGGNKFYKDFSLAHSENISKEQTSREAAYKVVVKFVKWYNEQLKTIEDVKDDRR